MERANIRIFDKDINFLGEVDDYTSLVFIRKWKNAHEFEFHVNEWDSSLYKKGNVIMLDKDTSKVGVIKYIEVSESGVDKDITVKGYGLAIWLKDRITYPPSGSSYDTFNQSIEDTMIDLIINNVANPADTNRIIPHFSYGGSQSRGGTVKFRTRFQNLFDEIVKLSEMSRLGFNVYINSQFNTFVFEVLEGTDRSVNQSTNPYAIFSKNFDNLKEINYIESDIDYKNCAIVGGQGSGKNREITYVGNTLTGTDRKEVFVDARDVDSTAELEDRGEEKLAEYQETLSFECEIDTSGYKTLWDLGDFVTIKDDGIGVIERSQILEVKEIYEKDMKIEVVFGNSTINFRDKVKQIADEVVSRDIVQGNHIITGEGLKYQLLWSGLMGDGDSITVPDIGKFRMFVVRFASSDETTSVALMVLCVKYGSTRLRGFNGYPDNSRFRIYGVDLSISETTVTAVSVGFSYHDGTYVARKINAIYGLL